MTSAIQSATHHLGSATKLWNGLFVSGISASGDISSSGGTGSFAGGVDCIGDSLNATGAFGYISSSGDISTSSDIYGTTGSFIGGIHYFFDAKYLKNVF